MSISAKARFSCQGVDGYIDGLFSGAAAELPEHVRRHIAECPRCAELHRFALAKGTEPAVSDDLAGRISSALSEDLRPVKPLPSTGILTLRFLAIFAALDALLLFWLGTAGLERMSVTQVSVVAALLAAGAVLLAVSLSWQMVPGERQRIPLPLLLAAFGAGFLLVAAGLFPWEGRGFVDAGWGCARAGLLISIPVGILLLYIAMRGAPLSYGKLGASLGATSGLLGLTVLQFHCDNLDAAHVLFSHGAIVAVSTAAGGLIGLAVSRFSLRKPS